MWAAKCAKSAMPTSGSTSYKNPHYKSIAAGNLPPAITGCEGCHGPGQAHVKAGGGKTTIPRAFSLMPPAKILETCLTCHAKDLSKANIRRSSHTEADVVCTNCHSIHKSQTPKFLLASKQTTLCYSCHSNVRAQFEMPVKHRVNEGAIQCSDCHNPHGTFAPTWRMGQRPRMVRQSLGTKKYASAATTTNAARLCSSTHPSPWRVARLAIIRTAP